MHIDIVELKHSIGLYILNMSLFDVEGALYDISK